MADYQELYAVLFQGVTKAIDILQQVQQAVEEMYLSEDDTIIKSLPPNGGSKNEDGDCLE